MDSETKQFKEQLEDALKGAALFDKEHAQLLIKVLVDMKIDVDNSLHRSRQITNENRDDLNNIRQHRYTEETIRTGMVMDIEALKLQIKKLQETVEVLECKNNPNPKEQSNSFAQKLLKTTKQK